MLWLTDRRLAKLPLLSRPLLGVAGVFLLLLKASAGDSAAEAFLRGKADFERRAFAPALVAFEQALQDEPKQPVYLLWAGRAAGRLAEEAGPFKAFSLARKTRECFERAYALAPRDPEVVADLAEFYEKAPGFMGGNAEAARRLRAELKALRAAP